MSDRATVYVVHHYFVDRARSRSYYPGETFSAEQLLEAGMSAEEIAYWCEREKLGETETVGLADPDQAEAARAAEHLLHSLTAPPVSPAPPADDAEGPPAA